MKLKAKPVEPGKYDLVLHPSHPVVDDSRVGGPSDRTRSFAVDGSELCRHEFSNARQAWQTAIRVKDCQLRCRQNSAGRLATVGYDDEGVPGQRWHLIKRRLFVDWQTTRDLAAMTPARSRTAAITATVGAASRSRACPTFRCSRSDNKTLDDLIAGVEKGILIYGDGSYSIDQQRYNFQFGGQVFWEIKNGKRGEMLRDVAYQSRTTDFWNSLRRPRRASELRTRRQLQRWQGRTRTVERGESRLSPGSLPAGQRT
jgi:TldD protein